MEQHIEIKKLEDWGISSIEKPLFISGPCSAETEEQVVNTAKELKNTGVQVYRAGIWKPRTRANTFEGVGSQGLEWLKTAKQETGLLTSTEVAQVKHVYEALKAGVDIIWIGARTSANPFAMQEIADSLRGVNIPVFVKNPINPDVELWIGAIERLNQAGIDKIGAIHRGFSTYEQSLFRNIPKWQIPIELKRRLPNLPLICDPSHIGGRRSLIQSLSQKALDLNFDGLMVEVHPDPDCAWSDAKQQITPAAFDEMLEKLVFRQVKPENVSLDELEDLRYKIDIYDQEIIKIIGKRMEEVEAIGRYKKENNMTVLQSKRWDHLLDKNIKKGEEAQLSPEIIAAVFKAIHQESINKQTQILNG
ncbi:MULTISPECIES: bifunctional 3-deoxy-7-phosphoheptulonate synthase/chorismate mutase type II [unclassified Lentimicrobium]|uniref:bifunctional 3-deoxy-7-phosphoheptulonate synthase/chorismate mutase type II n=1 Tax=unclassified Lentimicrobium TaxID=2677434 RepID=UPI001C12EC73|nr:MULTISPECIES: bifunctional 3-deoxy-7-phosphoheptulonate synthase/chorismate mutase type II [unclassified Lentimicrobium]NPD45377.1 bifunctional 3-deoxy-7-phosphoheptulonate synthase/chorismate mutase type II [Lentimicrobium sp. S6]NPD85256.1 bifunctional 3-deoxy-7-phosphoheptulonate synthase/chorismate mutase type II [Lentimicrobium sp. L6]